MILSENVPGDDLHEDLLRARHRGHAVAQPLRERAGAAQLELQAQGPHMGGLLPLLLQPGLGLGDELREAVDGGIGSQRAVRAAGALVQPLKCEYALPINSTDLCDM